MIKSIHIKRAAVVLLAIAMAKSNSSSALESASLVVQSEAAETAPVAEAKTLESDEANLVEDTDAVAPDISEKKRKWSAPDYSNQGPALGYKPDTFAIPERMKSRVQFWTDIYTKYSTDQGLLHDSLHVSAVYEPLDFTPIMQDASLTSREKAKARKKLLEDHKNAIKERLLGLHTMTTGKAAENFVATSLTGEDLRIYNMFAADTDPNKFKNAAQKGRLRFQLGQRDKFIQGIYYSGRYLRDMEKVFHDAGLPVEITRLPFVESSFNVKARSRVGASGIWQFMRYTGRKFMRVSGTSDERNDPMKATRAAARMLRINYEMLQDWSLAITGYNHGPAGVARMVKKFKTEDICDLVDERNGRFGFASANFFASFLAAVHVEREAEKYFGPVFWDSPVATEEVITSRPVNKKMLLTWFNGDLEKAKEYNLHLTRTFWSGFGSLGNKDFVRIPADKAMAVREDIAKGKVFAEESRKGEKTLASAGGTSVDAVDGVEPYVIGPGETLSEIASQFGLSVTKLIDLNDIENPRRVRAGQKILVPKK